MPKCCACNSSGSCKFCVCVRSNRRCSNCSPSQHSRCENTALSGTTRTARITSSLGKPSRVTSTSKPSKRCSLSLRSVSSSRSSSPLASSCPPSLVASNAEKAGASAAGDQYAGVVGENSALSGELPGFNGSQPLRTSPTSFTTMVGDGQRQENSAPVAPVELVAPVAPVSTPAFPARENRLPTEFDEGRTTLTPHGNSRETSLPSFAPLSTPDFQWGCQPGHEFSRSIRAAYQETVHWRRNVFLVPSGKVGKDFVR